MSSLRCSVDCKHCVECITFDVEESMVDAYALPTTAEEAIKLGETVRLQIPLYF